MTIKYYSILRPNSSVQFSKRNNSPASCQHLQIICLSAERGKKQQKDKNEGDLILFYRTDVTYCLWRNRNCSWSWTRESEISCEEDATTDFSLQQEDPWIKQTGVWTKSNVSRHLSVRKTSGWFRHKKKISSQVCPNWEKMIYSHFPQFGSEKHSHCCHKDISFLNSCVIIICYHFFMFVKPVAFRTASLSSKHRQQPAATAVTARGQQGAESVFQKG